MSSPSFVEIFDKLSEKLHQSGEVVAVSRSFSNLKCDEDRLKVAWFHLNKFKTLPSDYVYEGSKKDSLRSISLRNEGNSAFQKNDDAQALELYTNCIAWAPFPCQPSETDMSPTHANEDIKDTNSSALSVGFANRSAVFFSRCQYDACIADVDQALKYHYPAHLKYKLLERKGKCLQKQGKLEDSRSYYLEALQLLPLSELPASKKLSVEEGLQELMKSLESPRELILPQEKKNVVVPPLKYERHETFTSASKCLEVKFCHEKGRFMMATRNIHPGDVIIIEDPYASVLSPDCFKSHCYNCHKRYKALIPCFYCSMVMYCSETCRHESWERNHQIDCHFLHVLVTLKAHKMAHLAMQIVIVASACGQNLFELQKFITKLEEESQSAQECLGFDDESQSAHRCLGLDENGAYKFNNYATIYHLYGNTDKRRTGDLFRRALIAACLLNCLEHWSSFFQNAIDTPSFSEISTMVGGLLLRHLQNLPCNAHEISDYVRDVTDSENGSTETCEIAAGAYATLSLLNHSCDPNVTRTNYCGDTAVVQAIKLIKTGDEILDSYGYHYAIHSREERQTNLASQYFFECHCEACMRDWPLYLEHPNASPLYKCSQCNHILAQFNDLSNDICDNCKTILHLKDVDRVINASSSKFQENLQKVLSGKVGGMMPELCDHLELLENHVQRPWKEYSDCQEALKECFFHSGNFYVVS